ncbi:MAG: DNA repair protein RadC [Clostridia bacterium]|nr:DNA repair protein RadC [Clostridia bacterium]
MSLKMKELPESERPYEKMQMYGKEHLTDSELLAIIIKCGTKEDTSIGLAQKILKLNQKSSKRDLRFLQEVSIEQLMEIKGIGKVKAMQIMAICELAKRMSKPIQFLKTVIKTSEDVANLLMDELKYEKREIMKLLILNSKNVLLKNIDIALGGVNFASIEPSVILAEPVKMNAPNIILVHNHPSGDPRPSQNDFRLTDRLYECADVMGIRLMDHVIIGDNCFESVLKKKK